MQWQNTVRVTASGVAVPSDVISEQLAVTSGNLMHDVLLIPEKIKVVLVNNLRCCVLTRDVVETRLLETETETQGFETETETVYKKRSFISKCTI